MFFFVIEHIGCVVVLDYAHVVMSSVSAKFICMVTGGKPVPRYSLITFVIIVLCQASMVAISFIGTEKPIYSSHIRALSALVSFILCLLRLAFVLLCKRFHSGSGRGNLQ